MKYLYYVYISLFFTKITTSNFWGNQIPLPCLKFVEMKLPLTGKQKYSKNYRNEHPKQTLIRTIIIFITIITIIQEIKLLCNW